MPTQDGEQLAMSWVGWETPAQARSSRSCCPAMRAGPQHPPRDWKGFGSLSRLREVEGGEGGYERGPGASCSHSPGFEAKPRSQRVWEGLVALQTEEEATGLAAAVREPGDV